MSKIAVMRTYLVAFILVMGFVSYMSFTQPIPTRRPDVQTKLYNDVPKAQPGPPPTATPVKKGEALAVMEIPRFGKDWVWTVSEGTTLDVLDQGPGHFIGTALPGEKGNSAYAAHRATHGDPFLDFDLLRKGDKVMLSQEGATWIYKLTLDPVIIDPNEGWVIKDMTHGHWLTLITCWPKYGSSKRMYVRAKLVNREYEGK